MFYLTPPRHISTLPNRVDCAITSFDIIWLSGWTPHESQPKPLRPGSAKASLEAAVKRTPK